MKRESESEVFDLRYALSALGEDREFLVELAGLFQAAWPSLRTDIREALAAGQLRIVEKSARLVEAAARNISAKKVCESARCLQTLAHQGALDSARSAGVSLEHEVEELMPHLSIVNDTGREGKKMKSCGEGA